MVVLIKVCFKKIEHSRNFYNYLNKIEIVDFKENKTDLKIIDFILRVFLVSIFVIKIVFDFIAEKVILILKPFKI